MTSAYDFSFRDIDGSGLPLSRFAGKALLIVNVASQCGLTPQYEGLQRLWQSKREAGLVILGVPCNDFGAQEPGSEAEIKQFCQTRYAADFPLAAKEHVLGAHAHPLYRWVVEELGDAAAPKWNFHKYLFGRQGHIAGSFGSRVEPEAPELTGAIADALS